VRVAEDVPAPLVARVSIGLFLADGGNRLPTVAGESPLIGRTKVVPSRWLDVDDRTATARLQWAGGNASSSPPGALILEPAWDPHPSPEGIVQVSFVWHVLSAPERDYTVFVHLEDDLGTVVGAGDSAPRGGLYPTWAWEAGESFHDTYTVSVREDAAPGRYRLLVGLYGDDGRLEAYTPSGQRWAADAIELGTVDLP
jgi:hypothetical protein